MKEKEEKEEVPEQDSVGCVPMIEAENKMNRGV